MKTGSLLDYSEFKALLGEIKRYSDPLCCRFFFRPLSFPIGWLFYKIGFINNFFRLSNYTVTFF